MVQFIITIIVVLAGSAFFSGLEAALFAVPESRALIYKKQKKVGGKALFAIKKKMNRAITVIVIGNNIFNIVGSMIIGFLAAKTFHSIPLGIISAIFTFLVIVFGEIFPKILGENYADTISLVLAPPLLFAVRILFPLVWCLEKMTQYFHTERKAMTEEELTILSELSHDEGSIETDEHEMIRRVFTLNDSSATDIMTDKTELVAYQESVDLGHLEEKIYELEHSRIPVYGESVDDITGIVKRWDLLAALGQDRQRTPIKEFAHKALFVSADMKADDLLPFFQKTREHLAIVRGKNGETLGVVTLEDVVEELVGEIKDETDEG